jgi:hypothetical protein
MHPSLKLAFDAGAQEAQQGFNPKLAYEAGAQQALVDSGVTKTANIGDQLSGLYDSAVDGTSRGIGALDDLLGNPILNMAGIDPAIAVGNPGTPALRNARDRNLYVNSERALDEMNRLKLEQLARRDSGSDPDAELSRRIIAAANRGHRLQSARARNNAEGNPAASWVPDLQSIWGGADRYHSFLDDKWSARPLRRAPTALEGLMLTPDPSVLTD